MRADRLMGIGNRAVRITVREMMVMEKRRGCDEGNSERNEKLRKGEREKTKKSRRRRRR